MRKSQVQRLVDKSFKRLGDLATEITLISRTAQSFSFSSAAPLMSQEVTLVVRGVVEYAKQEDLGSYEMKVLFPASKVNDLSIYTQAVVGGTTYTVVTPSEPEASSSSSDGYLYTLFLKRGVM